MKGSILNLKHITLNMKELLFNILIMLVVPAAAGFLLGYQMKAHQIKNIPTIIVDHDNSSLSQTLVKEIRTNEIFNVTNYSQNDEDIKILMDKEKIRVGIIIPSSFSKDLTNGNAPKVLIFYDGSQMAITGVAKARMSEILLSIKTEYLQELMQKKLGVMPGVSKNKVLPMYFTTRCLNNPTKNYINFLLPGFIISIIQVVIVMMGVNIIKKENKYFFWLLIKGISWSILGVISIVISFGIQFKYFGMPFRGTRSGSLMLTIIYSFGMVAYGMLFGLIIPKKLFALQISALTVLPSMLTGGFSFPLFAMPDFFEKLGIIMPFVHYAETIRSLCVNDLNLSDILPEIHWLFKFAIYMWISSFVVFMLKKFIKKEINYIKNKKQNSKKEAQYD